MTVPGLQSSLIGDDSPKEEFCKRKDTQVTQGTNLNNSPIAMF